MNNPVLATVQIPTDVATLRSSIAGDVYVPGDEGYDEARRAWNLFADQRPSVIVMPESAVDVVKAVRFARAEGLRVAPQGTGHGATAVESLEGAMLLKTTRMRRVEIYPASRTARAEAGAEWQDVTIPAAEHGLAALAGSSPDVGVVGYTLGGGMGWLARRYGLAANSVTAVEMVTPDGRLVRADAYNEPDLLWAVRGAGGQVGIVTAIEFTLYPVREAYAGTLFFPLERASEVLHAWREWTDTVPDEVTSVGRILQFPPIPDLPDFLRGQQFVVVEAAYLGDEFEGAELIRPLRELGPDMDTFAMIPAPDLQHLHMDPPEPVPGQGDGTYLTDFTPGAIDALVATAGAGSGSPLLSVEVRHCGGAMAQGGGDGAQANADAKFMLFGVGLTPTEEIAEAVRSHVRVVLDTLSPWRAEYDYFNLREEAAGAEEVLPAESYRRLREIKARYDAGEMIVTGHPVRPAR
ncbi:MAG TPA: FAD-binding oxidoreductase [Thermoleophilaceae bacterium]|nr:FAD-binding oxidoreductase [Thermoleophilaceae bacterium]